MLEIEAGEKLYEELLNLDEEQTANFFGCLAGFEGNTDVSLLELTDKEEKILSRFGHMLGKTCQKYLEYFHERKDQSAEKVKERFLLECISALEYETCSVDFLQKVIKEYNELELQ